MLKMIFLICLQCAMGFLTVSFVFMTAQRLGHIPSEVYEVPDNIYYKGFYEGTLIAWFVGCLAAITALTGYITDGRLGLTARWAPLWLPIVYGCLSYVFLTRDVLFS